MYMKSNDLVGHSLLKNRRNYKRKSKYETGYSADNMVYKNFIKDIYEVEEDEDMNPVGPSYDMPKYLYHATFTKNVPSIKQKGLLQFEPSLWIKKGGGRYNEDAGIFAFDDPEDALNWAGKMEWEFRDTDKDISIVRIDMEDEIWDDDPAEDPFVSNKGRALRSGANINADRIVDAIRMDDLGKPGNLGISRDEWLAQVTPKLREDTMAGRKFYHGSFDEFEVGEILTPGEDDYEEHWGHNHWYQALEKYRPMENRPHAWSVFMVDNLDDVDVAGGGTEYVYEVEPAGDVERHDINWATELSYLFDKGFDVKSDEVKEAALNYWKGVPHPNESVWEYIAPKARIVGILEEGDMKADREAGIKYVDDPDWKRLHDMDDKIIQAYMDHKNPKEELHEKALSDIIETDTYGAFISKYKTEPNERGKYEGKLHPPKHLKDKVPTKSLEASSFEELKRLAHDWIDKTRESFKPIRNWSDVKGAPTLDLNREFIRDELGVNAEHWIKITKLNNGDIALLVAPDDAIKDYGLDTVQGEDYKRMTPKRSPQGVITNTAAAGMSKAKAQRLKLTPNGRYTLHKIDKKSDSMGSDIFLMKYDSIVDDPNIPQQLHQPAVTVAASRQIINADLLSEGINDPHIFKAVFMAGGPGSGKSYMARELLGGTGLKAVNTDQALEYLMAKHDLDPTMPDEEQEQRDVQRGRAKEITIKRRDNYVDGRLGLIIDGTGKDASKIQKAKQALEDIGYETRMIFVDATLDTAQQRNMKRPERSVPLKLLNRLWTMSQENIPALKTLFGGNFSKVNNNEQISQEDVKLHREVYNNTVRWLDRPVTNREALDWMDQQTGFSEGLATITEDACGDCFSKAGRALMDADLPDDTTLVHALVRGQGKLEGRRFPHAWTEIGDVVFDKANGNNIVMRKEQYYKLGGVEEAKGAFARYEHHKGLANMLKQGHWGPWDLDDSLNEEEKPEHNSGIANALEGKLPKSHRSYKKQMAAIAISKSNSA